MKNIYKLSLIFALFVVSNSANAQLRRIYNEQQLQMLEMNGLLHTIDDDQISDSAKQSKIYKKYKKAVRVDEKATRRKEKKLKKARKKSVK